MKDLLFTVERQRKELLLFAFCFVVAFGLNVYSIIAYGTEWKELYTQLLWVLIVALFLYGVLLFCRLIYWGVRRLTGRKRRRSTYYRRP